MRSLCGECLRSGSLKAEPEMGILVPEIVKGGSQRGVGGAGWHRTASPDGCGYSLSIASTQARPTANHWFEAFGGRGTNLPVQVAPIWQTAIPQDVVGIQQLTVHSTGGMGTSAQLSK